MRTLRTWIGIAIVLNLLAASQAAWAAGPSSGGGGPAVVCRGADGKIARAELLDLYEGRIRFGFSPAPSSAPVDEQVERAMARLRTLDGFMAMDVQTALVAIHRRVTFLPDGVIMAPGVDLGESQAALIPDGCELAYVGYFESDGTLRVSKTVFDKLSPTDQAALFIHEAIYLSARTIARAKNSLATRALVAYLFSGSSSFLSWAEHRASLVWQSLEEHDAAGNWFALSHQNFFFASALSSSVTLEFTEGTISGFSSFVYCNGAGVKNSRQILPKQVVNGRVVASFPGACRSFSVGFDNDQGAPFAVRVIYGGQDLGIHRSGPAPGQGQLQVLELDRVAYVR